MYVSKTALRKPRKTNEEYSAATRAALLRVARRAFARSGYADTTADEIVRQARVTRGALYHHYDGKLELFEAVLGELARELGERISRSALSTRDPFQALVRGCDAWLDASLDAQVQRIVLLDGPSVLGWERWIATYTRYDAGRLRHGIDACIAAGLFVSVDAESLTGLIMGATNHMAMMLASAPDPRSLRRKAGQTLRALLEGLRR